MISTIFASTIIFLLIKQCTAGNCDKLVFITKENPCVRSSSLLPCFNLTHYYKDGKLKKKNKVERVMAALELITVYHSSILELLDSLGEELTCK